MCEYFPSVYGALSVTKDALFSRVSVSLDDTVPLGVIIDAPQLSYLIIVDLFSESFIVNNLKSSAELDISLTFGLFCINETSISSVTSHIRNFLGGISKVGDLTIYASTFKIMYIYSKSESQPIVKWLPTFLEKCPNLKSLSLRLDDYFDLKKLHSGDMNQVVPKCLLSSLEFVVFKFQVWSLVAEMKLVKYLLENSAILKKLTLHLDSHLKEDKILKQLSQIPRASTRCEIVIVKA